MENLVRDANIFKVGWNGTVWLERIDSALKMKLQYIFLLEYSVSEPTLMNREEL